MQSLEVLSCLKLVKDMSLTEIIEFTNRKQNGLMAQLCDSSNFWKAVIERFYGKTLLQQRLDIDPRDYKLMASELGADTQTFYCTMLNLDPPESKVFNPVEIANLEDESLINDIDDLPINVKIPGLKPVVRCVGYIASYTFSINSHAVRNTNSYYLAGNIENLSEAEFNLKYTLAEKAYTDLMSVSRVGESMDFFSLNRTMLNIEPDSLEFKEKFIKMFLMQVIRADSSLATEFFIASPPDGDTHVQIWVAQVEF